MSSARPEYAELHAHSAFSFLDGASLPEELAAAAAALGYGAIALTDHDGIWGSMEFAQACRGLGVRPITGAEVTIAAPGSPLPADPHRGNCPPGCFHLTLLVADARGYRNLCRLLTIAHAHTRGWAGSGETPSPGRDDLVHPALPFAELEQHADGLVCLSGCARDGALGGRLRRGAAASGGAAGRGYCSGPSAASASGSSCSGRSGGAIAPATGGWLELAEVLGVAPVATGNVHYHHRRRAALQDALVAARLLGTLESTEPTRRGNGAGFLTAAGRMAGRFAEHPEAVAETVRIAERIEFDLTRDLGYRYPGSEDPDADRKLAEALQIALRRALRGRRPSCPRRSGASRRSCG